MLEGNFVTFVAQDQGAEARAVLQDDLSQRVLDHLEERKRELAAGLFSGHAKEESEQVTENTDLTAFKKAGGKITQVPPHAAHGAQAKQKVKVPMRHLGAMTPRKGE